MNTLPRTIVASVSDTFLDKAPRLFNASLGDILNEMFQNARRAGATSVEITTAPVDEDNLLRYFAAAERSKATQRAG